jgi:hypothetical protein
LYAAFRIIEKAEVLDRTRGFAHHEFDAGLGDDVPIAFSE